MAVCDHAAKRIAPFLLARRMVRGRENNGSFSSRYPAYRECTDIYRDGDGQVLLSLTFSLTCMTVVESRNG